MNDSLNKIIEQSNKLTKSKNILIGVIIFIILNIFFIEHYINHENRDLLITNDLYYLNKLNKETYFNKNLDNPIFNQDTISVTGNTNENKNNDKENAEVIQNINEKKEIDEKLVSIKSIEICSKACDGESELYKKPCFNQCLKDYEGQHKDSIHSQYVFILFIILIAFICSFFSYMKKNLYILDAKKDYLSFIQCHLLEGYDLINE